jgi:hypothetical protein
MLFYIYFVCIKVFNELFQISSPMIIIMKQLYQKKQMKPFFTMNFH